MSDQQSISVTVAIPQTPEEWREWEARDRANSPAAYALHDHLMERLTSPELKKQAFRFACALGFHRWTPWKNEGRWRMHLYNPDGSMCVANYRVAARHTRTCACCGKAEVDYV